MAAESCRPENLSVFTYAALRTTPTCGPKPPETQARWAKLHRIYLYNYLMLLDVYQWSSKGRRKSVPVLIYTSVF